MAFLDPVIVKPFVPRNSVQEAKGEDAPLASHECRDEPEGLGSETKETGVPLGWLGVCLLTEVDPGDTQDSYEGLDDDINHGPTTSLPVRGLG